MTCVCELDSYIFFVCMLRLDGMYPPFLSLSLFIPSFLCSFVLLFRRSSFPSFLLRFFGFSVLLFFCSVYRGPWPAFSAAASVSGRSLGRPQRTQCSGTSIAVTTSAERTPGYLCDSYSSPCRRRKPCRQLYRLPFG